MNLDRAADLYILNARTERHLANNTVAAYSRDLARRGFISRDETLWEQLLRYYTEPQRAAIDSSARVINLANRCGNTFDAARERLGGRCEKTDASALDMTVVSTVFAAGAALVSPVVGTLMVLHKVRGR